MARIAAEVKDVNIVTGWHGQDFYCIWAQQFGSSKRRGQEHE